MNILLINTNPVVSRLISLCLRDDTVVFEEVEDVAEAKESTYDIVFVDDASYNDKVAAFSSWVANIGKLVFLSNHGIEAESDERFDLVITKPFLPSQIQEIIAQAKEDREDRDIQDAPPVPMEESVLEEIMPIEDEKGEQETIGTITEEETFIPPYEVLHELEGEDDAVRKKDGEEASSEDLPKVLDSNDIEQIKTLLEEDEKDLPEVDLGDERKIEARKIEVITKKLEEDGLEIVDEGMIIDELSREPAKVPKRKRKSKKRKEHLKEANTFEEALLVTIGSMKPKKIRKILKGARVTIKIRFKDEV